jgi:RecA-family ATPase
MLKKDTTNNPNIPEEDLAKAYAEAQDTVAKAAATAEATESTELKAKRVARRQASAKIMLKYMTEDPPPADYVWTGFLRGTVGGLIAAGATGKSFLAIEIAMCVASPVANAKLLKFEIPKHGRVAIINAEDPEQVLWERIRAISKQIKMSITEMKDMVYRIEIVSLFGKPETDMMDELFRAHMLEYAHETRLIIYDTLNRLAGESNENDNAEMALLLKGFEYVSARANSAGLILHHSTKGASGKGEQDKQEAARGASSITSNLRWQGYMQTMTKDEAIPLKIKEEDRHQYVRFGGNKENYGSKTPAIWLQRHDKGVLLPVTFKAEQDNVDFSTEPRTQPETKVKAKPKAEGKIVAKSKNAPGRTYAKA